jgi:hypothetical protein
MQNADQATGGQVLHTALVLHCSDITKMKVAIMIISYGNTIKGLGLRCGLLPSSKHC